MDVSLAKITVPHLHGATTMACRIPSAAIARAVMACRHSQRAAVLAGNGLRASDGPMALRALAERLQWPVITTPRAKGVFPEAHPLSLGVFGLGGHPSAQQYVAQGMDTLLVLGASLGDLATDGWTKALYPTRNLIQVGFEAAQFGRGYPTDLAIAAPPDQFAHELSAQLPVCTTARTFGVEYHEDAATALRSADGRIAPHRTLWELQEVLPPKTIFAVDSGEHFLFAAHYLRINEPDSFIAMIGLGAMGAGFGAAIGANFSYRDFLHDLHGKSWLAGVRPSNACQRVSRDWVHFAALAAL